MCVLCESIYIYACMFKTRETVCGGREVWKRGGSEVGGRKKGVDRWEKKNGVDGPSVCVSGRDGNPRGDQSNEYGGINTDAM